MAAVRVALAQEGRDPSGAALAVPAPAAAPAMVLADCSDHRDRSQVWESASSAPIGGMQNVGHPEELNATQL